MILKKNREKDKIEDKIHERNLHLIFDNLPDPIFVTDREGNVLLSNSTTALTLNISLPQLLKSNVKELVDKAFYDKSYILEACKSKTVVSGLVKTRMNYTLISTSTPVLDENGNVELVITSARPYDLMEKYIRQEERSTNNQQKREIEYLRSYVLEKGEIVAESPSMKAVLFAANLVAPIDSAVVLYGETGTGKEVLASYLHRHSKREKKPFIAINCAALPEHLVEAELFGYEKGAFTGAVSEGKIGLFEAADQGTLFLDEIAELPLSMQSKLLRVLETYEVRRIGSNVSRKIDFRVIVATHKDLKKMMDEGLFRADLYYRLNVFPIVIAPLRERKEDILALAVMFLEKFNREYERDLKLDADMIEKLQSHAWPGNVRELRNEIERRVINSHQELLSCDNPMLSSDLGITQGSKGDIIDILGLQGTLETVIQNVEARYIDHVIDECGGRVSEAADRLGIHRSVLYRKMKEYGFGK